MPLRDLVSLERLYIERIIQTCNHIYIRYTEEERENFDIEPDLLETALRLYALYGTVMIPENIISFPALRNTDQIFEFNSILESAFTSNSSAELRFLLSRIYKLYSLDTNNPIPEQYISDVLDLFELIITNTVEQRQSETVSNINILTSIISSIEREVNDSILETLRVDIAGSVSATEYLVGATATRNIRSHLNTDEQESVNEFNQEKPKLRQRASKDGSNDEAHNLTVKYQYCVGILKEEKAIQIIQFITEKNKLFFMGREYLAKSSNSQGGYKELPLQPYKPEELFLPNAQPGWTMDDDGLYLLTLVPGTYTRGMSFNNLIPEWIITKTSIHHKLRLNWTKNLIFNVARRPYLSIKDGVSKKLPWFVTNPQTAGVLRTNNGKEKVFILVNSLCIGEYVPKNKKVKVYRYYEKCKGFLEKTIQNEVE